MQPVIFIFVLILLVQSCQTTEPRHSIATFDEKLQPHLYATVNAGLHAPWEKSPAFILANITPAQLISLSNSEHPLLRALALVKMVTDSSMDTEKIINEHLDDHALIMIDQGEFGYGAETVADLILKQCIWKDSAFLLRIIDEVIENHNDLRVTYLVSQYFPKQKHVPSLRQMAKCWRPVDEKEAVLMALAKLKDPANTQLIRDEIYRLNGQFGYLVFQLMKDYWDDSYFLILEEYAYRWLADFSNRIRRSSDNGHYFNTLASVKNEKSARLLTDIYTGKVKFSYDDTSSVFSQLRMAVWENYCPAYKSLRSMIAPTVREEQALRLSFELPHQKEDQQPEPIRWPGYSLANPLP